MGFRNLWGLLGGEKKGSETMRGIYVTKIVIEEIAIYFLYNPSDDTLIEKTGRAGELVAGVNFSAAPVVRNVGYNEMPSNFKKKLEDYLARGSSDSGVVAGVKKQVMGAASLNRSDYSGLSFAIGIKVETARRAAAAAEAAKRAAKGGLSVQVVDKKGKLV
ncbi:hypothetical protein FJZ19_05585 [Candidatus Pacearchaeota archaeon]|nr:hypothetical protein [Candidatus Pacearchaeota archaeon]